MNHILDMYFGDIIMIEDNTNREYRIIDINYCLYLYKTKKFEKGGWIFYMTTQLVYLNI